jgi:glutamine synthetase
MVKIAAEYIWIGGNGDDIRSKCRTIDVKCHTNLISIDDLPIWNYDGSSTKQACGEDSEVMLHPVAVYKDPWRWDGCVLVLCETMLPDGTPALHNNCHAARKIFDKQDVILEDTWFGIEQEYTLFESDGKTPLGWPVGGFPSPQGPYYCGVGYDKAVGRNISEEHYVACLKAGLQISGTNAEVMKGQWEYQIGPSLGLSSGHEVWMSRYLMLRVCENNQVHVSFDPKPIDSYDWNGSGCHTNYSTKSMRDGLPGSIETALVGLRSSHARLMALYGDGNDRRMTGLLETSSMTKFSYGVANRGCSVRIPRDTAVNKRGYIEDRRPASNMDPYIVTSNIVQVTIVEDNGIPDFELDEDTYFSS